MTKNNGNETDTINTCPSVITTLIIQGIQDILIARDLVTWLRYYHGVFHCQITISADYC